MTSSGGALGGGGSGPPGGRSGGGGTPTMTGGIPSGSGGVAGDRGSSAGGMGDAAPDAALDAALDAANEDANKADRPALCTGACVLPNCPGGTVKGPPPCSCPICAPVDAGQSSDGPTSDGPMVCSGIACPMIACLNGYVPSPTPCGCATCARVDAGDGLGVGAACGATNDPACASGTHCEWSDKLCGTRTRGACVSFPGGALCAISAEPVCGCDGKNYPSPCEAARNGVDVSSNAICPQPTGLFRCGWSYCQHGVQYCHAQVGGAITNPGSYACTALPAACGGVPSCACVAGNATICTTDTNGDVTATLEVP